MSIGNILISVTHRTLDNSFEYSIELFNEEFNKYIIDICKLQNNTVIWAGDFNKKLFKYTEHKPKTEIINLLFSYNLFLFISRPILVTNTSVTLIDVIFVTNNLTVTHTDIFSADSSDHFPACAIFPLFINLRKENKILYRDMSWNNTNNLCNAWIITDWQKKLV